MITRYSMIEVHVSILVVLLTFSREQIFQLMTNCLSHYKIKQKKKGTTNLCHISIAL